MIDDIIKKLESFGVKVKKQKLDAVDDYLLTLNCSEEIFKEVETMRYKVFGEHKIFSLYGKNGRYYLHTCRS